VNYLQLCQAARRECRITGTGPSAVAGQVGQLARIVAWVDDAWTSIQNDQDWRWMRSTFTVSTTEDDDDYAFGECTDVAAAALISRFGRWRLNDLEDPPKIYLSSTGVGGETFMSWIEWEHFKAIYRRSTQTSGHPVHISVDPADNIVIGPQPDGVYVVTGDYYKAAQTLSDDSDTPEMPARFHNLIVYEVMEDYGLSEPAPEVYARGRARGRRMRAALQADQLERLRLAGPLV